MAKVNFQELKKDAEQMVSKLSEYHVNVASLLSTQKSRGLATVESAIRNAVDHLDRLPLAIEKAEDTSKRTTVGGTSRLSKPTSRTVNRSIKAVDQRS